MILSYLCHGIHEANPNDYTENNRVQQQQMKKKEQQDNDK